MPNKTEYIQLRVTPEAKAAIKAEATRLKVPVSSFILNCLVIRLPRLAGILWGRHD